MNETCRNTQDLLPWLVGGTLTSAETVAAFDHVRTCPSCQHELAFLVAAQRAVDNAWSSHPTLDVADALWAEIDDQLVPYDEVTSRQESWISVIAETIGRGLSPFSFVYDTLGLAYRIVTGRVRHVLSEII